MAEIDKNGKPQAPLSREQAAAKAAEAAMALAVARNTRQRAVYAAHAQTESTGIMRDGVAQSATLQVPPQNDTVAQTSEKTARQTRSAQPFEQRASIQSSALQEVETSRVVTATAASSQPQERTSAQPPARNARVGQDVAKKEGQPRSTVQRTSDAGLGEHSSGMLPGMSRSTRQQAEQHASGHDAASLCQPAKQASASVCQAPDAQSKLVKKLDTASSDDTIKSVQRQAQFHAQEQGATADEKKTEGQPKKASTGRAGKRKRNRTGISAVAVLMLSSFVVLAVSGATVFFNLNGFLFGRFADVEMPNFDGMDVSAVQYNDAYKSFHIKYEEVYTDEKPVGTIVGQNPRVPRRVKENANVTLYVSAGMRMVEVPGMSKMLREEAKQLLESVGLNAIFKPIDDTTTVPDTVLNTIPAAGETIPYGETVQVYFARSGNASKVEVPNCVGLATLSEAIRALATAGLSYELSKESVGEGAVTVQLPVAKEMVPRGTTVTLTVSSSNPTGLDALPQWQETGVDGHVHAYVASSVVSPNEYSIGFTVFTCSVCNYFYYGDFTQPSAG